MEKRTPYPYSTNWLQEFIDPAQMLKLYGSDFPLVDVSLIPDDEIMQHSSMATLTLLQKHTRRRELACREPLHEEKLMTIAQQLGSKMK